MVLNLSQSDLAYLDILKNLYQSIYNIRVVALLLSLTKTNMIQQLHLFRWVIPMTPQQVAQAFITGLKKGQLEILVGWQSYLVVWCQRLAPRLLEKILLLAIPKSKTINLSKIGQIAKSRI